MTVAIVGGTGFLGTAIAKALVARGADVVQIARGRRTETPTPGARFARSDKADAETLVDLFRRYGVREVVDVMTLTLATTAPLLAATARAGARYVMISAIDVTANYAGLARLETPPVLDRPTREDDPRRTVLYPYRTLPARPAGIDPALLRDYDKIPIEDAARADPALRALILRLPAIWGPGDPQRRFGWLLPALSSGGPGGAPLRMDARAAGWRQSMIYIDDAGDAVARATLSDVGHRVLNVAPPDPRTMGDWAARLARAAGAPVPREGIETVPPEARGLMADRADATDMRYPLTLDGAAYARLFGPVEIVPEAAALAATLAAG